MSNRLEHGRPPRFQPIPAVLRAAVACLLPAIGAAQLGGTLSLTAPPELGQAVSISLEAASPQAWVGLLWSPHPASIPLAFGTLELAPDGLVLAATGATDAAGSFAISFPTALQAGAVEAPVHAQALVADPVSGALALSSALHFRLLGSRAYVGLAPKEASAGRLQVYSAVSGALVFEREDPLGTELAPSAAGSDELPLVVLDRTHSRAAYAADGDRLVIFDNFSGAGLAEIALPGLSRQLLVDPGGRTIHALQTSSARLWRIDFATGAVLGWLDLSQLVSAQWVASHGARYAYFATAEVYGAGAGILRVDLLALAEMEYVELVAPAGPSAAASVEDLGWSGAELIAVGRSIAWPGPPGAGVPMMAAFSASVDYSGPAPSAVVASFSAGGSIGGAFYDLLVAPDLGAVAVWTGSFLYSLTFYGFSFLDPTQIHPFAPSHPFASSGMPDLCYDGELLWVLNDDSYDSGMQLWWLDLARRTWTKYTGPYWCEPGPFDLARVRDALVDRVFLASRSQWAGCPGEYGELIYIDLAAPGTSVSVQLPSEPVLLDAVVVRG